MFNPICIAALFLVCSLVTIRTSVGISLRDASSPNIDFVYSTLMVPGIAAFLLLPAQPESTTTKEIVKNDIAGLFGGKSFFMNISVLIIYR